MIRKNNLRKRKMDENDKVGGPKEREKEHNEDGKLWTKNE